MAGIRPSAVLSVERARRFLPAVGLLLLGVVFLGIASSTEVLHCRRSSGLCEWSKRDLYRSRASSFAVTDVREVRYVRGLGKNGQRGESALVFVSGREFHLAQDDRGPAHARFSALSRFFAGDGAELRDESQGSRVFYPLALACGVGFVVFLRRALAARSQARPAAPRPLTPAPPKWRREIWILSGVIALACAAQGILMLVSARTQGTLELECRGRCRFQGGECLPGGSVSMALDPGSYSVEVWTPQTEPPWTGRPVTIRVGEVTRFDCLP